MADSILIEIPKPDDFHLHLRQGPALEQYTQHSARDFQRALIMPNTLPPVKTPEDVKEYHRAIIAAASQAGYPEFQPLLTFKLGGDVHPSQVPALTGAGVVAGKYYPQGATTNSEDGVSNVRALYPLLEAMEAQDMVLCIHGEDPTSFSLDREAAFLPSLRTIAVDFPRLRIVLEHITTADALAAVSSLPDHVGATVTLHHLLCNLDHMIGGHLNPHLFCKPVLKAPQHQQALQQAVLAGHDRIFFGSDSAPHPVHDKESACGCAGVYTAPVALPMLAQWFASNGALELFEPFVARRGADFYHLPLPGDYPESRRIRIIEKPWQVPERYELVVPFSAGQELPYQTEQV
jgi:dihydroorotase